MAFIYAADLYCDECGEAIQEGLDAKGLSPADPHDEYSYNSDEYPKCARDDDESDCPQHCGSGPDCYSAEVLPDGHKVGYFFRNPLTSDGYEYVREAVADDRAAGRLDSVACLLWAPEYDL